MTGRTDINEINPTTVVRKLRDGGELAFIDVREHGQYGEAHPLRVVSIPYSVLEARVGAFVPRLTTRVVLLDDGDDVASRAGARLAGLGYTDISVMTGGMPAWSAAGLEVYQGVNVVCKAFGEVVEHACHTPAIDPSELDGMLRAGDDLVIVDGRTPEEFTRMSIPGGNSVPNAELVYRITDIAPHADTTVVVNCAGRTRSIIGAQTLRNAGVPNRVVALRGGTMAWRLSGLELAHGVKATMPDVTTAGRVEAQRYAEGMRERFDLPSVDLDTVQAWAADATRTTYVFDVRTVQEYAAGHLALAGHAPGGQLVQAADHWCAVWGARMVLVDEGSGIRATTAAHWMRQMHWDVHVLTGEFTHAMTVTGLPARGVAPTGDAIIDLIEPGELNDLLNQEPVSQGALHVVDVDISDAYAERRLPGAVWGVRPRLVAQLQELARGFSSEDTVVLYGEHETRARLAARDVMEAFDCRVRVLAGGREAWCAEGLPTERALGQPPDADRIDYLFFVHDRHLGNDQAARDYLAWEENLPAQLEREGEMGFALVLD